MRSNVKKMWTALLAVLFAAAVGFGLWFAFAPAARPASVQAVGDTSVARVELAVTEQDIYSSIPAASLYPNFVSGYYYAANSTVGNDLSGYGSQVSWQIYDAAEDGSIDKTKPLSSLSPDRVLDGGSVPESYTRYIVATLTLNGQEIESNELKITVKPDTISDFSVRLNNNIIASALTDLNLSDSNSDTLPISVTIEYQHTGLEREIQQGRKGEYGKFWIEYNTSTGTRDDVIEYGEDSFYVVYYEGNEKKTELVESTMFASIIVTEAYIEYPTWDNFTLPELPYTGEEQTVSLNGFDPEVMTATTSLAHEYDEEASGARPLQLTASATATYTIKIEAKEGYQFNKGIQDVKEAWKLTLTEETLSGGGSKITAITYTWSIVKAEINKVSVNDEWKSGWEYDPNAALPESSDIDISIVYDTGEEQTTVTKSPSDDDVKATVTFYFSGTANDGTTITDSETLPTNAGSYTWRVELTGMNNFEDFTGTDANGGSGSFTIQKKSLTVPELDYLSFTYNKQDQAPAPKVSVTESDPYTFSVTEQKDVGDDYTAAFTLKDADNYEWASGSSAQIDGATATYTWVIVKASVRVPTLTSKEYNGQSQTADISNDLYTAEQGNDWINAGSNYNVVLTLSDPANYKWEDGTVTSGDNGEKTTVTFIITQKKVEIIWSNTTLTYNGREQAPTATVNNKIGNDDVSLSVSGAETNANTDGATYTATVSLEGNAKDNYTLVGVENTTCSFTISPAEIGVEGTLSIKGWTYGEEANKPGGVELNDDTNDLLGTATATFKYEYLSSAEGSAYTETVPTDAGDYTVRLTISVNSNFTPYSTTANFTIKKDELTFGDATGVLGWTWGDTIPEHNDLIPAATYGTNEGEKVSSFTYTYYKAENDAISGVALAEKPSGAGNYILRVSVSEGDNYKAGSKDYSFTVKRGRASISIKIEGADNWAYLDLAENHAITVTVTVGEGNHAKITPQITYYTRGWNENGDWTTTQKPGDNSAAGYYYIGVEVADTDNYTGTSLGEDDTKSRFTIHKKQISIPELKDDDGGAGQRQLEFNGNSQAPKKIINVSNNVLACGTIEGATIQFLRYEGSLTDGKPQSYGDYWIVLQIAEAYRANYTWKINKQDQLGELEDVLEANEVLKVAFSITGTQYEIEISNEDWTIAEGSGITKLPTVKGKTESDQNTLNAALQASGVTVTFAYYLDGQDEAIATVSNGNSLTLSAVPKAVALHAGKYTLTVNISRSTNNDYSTSSASATFTVSAYELKKGDVNWTVPSGLVYRGTEYTFGGAGSNIHATYKTWSYANGVYSATENGGYLTLALTGEAGKILNAGDYTLTAELPQGETNVVWGDNASKTHTVTIEKRVVDVTLKEYTVTYNGEAFEPFEAKEGTDYTAAEASVDTVTGLISGDDLQITLTPSSDTDAGSYAWGEITWSNKNYSVNVTNRTEKVFKIAPAPITVTIKNQSSTYGEDLATLTYSVSGTTYDKESTIFTLSTEATSTSNVGDYDITGKMLTEGENARGGNYDVTFSGSGEGGETGVYTITQRSLTITVTGSIEYGEDAPTNVDDYIVTLNGALKGDVETLKDLLSITASGYSAGKDKDNYDLTVSGNESAASNSTWKNYNISYGTSTLTVEARDITVTITNVTTTYGTMGELKVDVTRSDNKDPIYSGDLVGSVTELTDPARYANVFKLVLKNEKDEVVEHTAKLDNGTYFIVLDESSKNSNYDITVTEGTYTVGRYGLSINLSQNLHAGETSPVYDGLAWTYSAKANYTVAGQSGEIDFTDQIVYYERTLSSFAETETQLDGAPVDAGFYWAVLPATAASGNFEPTSQVSTSFTIAQREVDVVWEENGFTYNGSDQKDDVTAGYRAYRKGEQDDTLTPLNVSISSGQTEFKNADSYTFKAVLSDQNYKLDGASEDGSVSRKYQMKKAEITISVSSPTFTYGKFDGKYSAGKGTETDQLTYKVNGLFGSDTVQVTLSYSRDGVPVTLPENVADYTVSASIAEHQNYTLGTVTSGTLKIEKKALTVTVDGTSIEYGEAAPSVYNVTLEGALSDEGAAIKKLLQFDTLEYSVGKDVGNYTVKASFGADENGILKNYEYTVTDDGVVATCTLKVTPRKITVEIKDVETAYGTAGTLTAHVTREDGTTNNAILDRDLVKDGGQVVSGIAQFANVFTLSLDNATLDRLLNVGDYTIVGAAVTTGDGAKGGNYEITFVGSQNYDGKEENAGLYTVDPLEVEVNFEVVSHEGSEDHVYDGSAWKFTATAEGVIGADGQKERVTFQVTYAASAGQLTGGFAVDAGSYTVSVKPTDGQLLSENGNYIAKPNEGETVCSHEFEIKKQVLDISWRFANWQDTDDGAMEEERGVNYIVGYNPDIMSYGTHSSELTIVNDGTNGQPFKVSFAPSGQTTYRIEIELTDYDNYCWRTPASNVSGDHDEIIQIGFTVGATTNNITFTEIANGVYGETYVVQIATSAGDTADEGTNVLIFADSVLDGVADDSSLIINYAKHVNGVTDGSDTRLKFTLSSLDGVDAGDYWIRVRALGAGVYGYGVGYCKVTIGKKTITKDEIDNIKFTTEFVYNGKEQKPVAIDLPEYLEVTFSQGPTNVTNGTLTATFTIVGNNCEFKGSVDSLTREVTIKITPYVITKIYWDENPSFTYDGTDQSKDVFVYFVDVDGTRAKLTATTEGGFLNAGDYTFEAQVPNGNYEFQDDLTITNTITMARKQVNVVILDQSGEYSGKEFELQTRYNIDGRWSHDTAQNDDLYKELAEKLDLVIQEGPAINAGTYTITLKDGYEDLQNYEVTLQTGKLTITPKQLTFTWPTVTGGVYQGENPGVTLTGNEFEGFVDGEGYGNIESLIKIVYSGTTNAGTPYSGVAVPTEAGSYTVTVTLEKGNYTLNSGAQAYLVARADYSFTVAIDGWTYNESANAPSVNEAHPEGLKVTYTYAEVFRSGVYGEFTETVPTNAGSYVVRAEYAQGSNYNAAIAETLFTIEKAEITVKITFKQQLTEGGNGWMYGMTPTVIYELQDGSNPGNGYVEATYSTGSWSGSAIPTEVGEYTLTVTVAETNNYESGSASVAFKIVQASEEQLSFTVTIESWTYGEEPHAPSVIWGGGLTGHPDQISPVYTYAKAKADGETYSDKDFSSTVPTNAGSYVVKATFAETDHYGKLSAMCQFTIEKATALIDTSGMQKSFTYNGRAQALSGAVLNHSETTLSYSPATVTAVGSYTVTISAKESENYTAATATVTVTVSRASAGFSVRIDDWTYGETPSRYTISGGSGGSVTVTYSGTTNAGVKYSSSKVPTEAGEYTITVVMSASGNYSGGTARDSFTIHRADAGAELTLAGWAYGETPNSYLLTPEFLRDEVIRAVYSDGTYFSEAVPQDVGSYTLTVTYGETDNYLGGEVSCKFSITRYDLGLSVSIEGWTYGDEPNKPVVTGADIVGLTLSYTGTANDGTTWSSNTAPEKAGSYTLTVTVTKAGSYTGESASTDFVIARRLLSAPAWDEEGMRELIEVCSGDRMTRAILGFDMSLMNAQSATAQFMFDGTGAASVTANIHGVYTIVVSLRDAANYGWADLNEGETLTGPVTLTWTLTERVISLLWLIILLAVLIVIALIVLIVLLKKGGKPDGTDTEEGGKPDGTDTGKGDVRLSSVAPVGLLLVVAPTGQLVAVIVLGAVLLALVAADIVLGVRNAKRAKAAENAQEPVPAYGDEAAAEGEAYPGTEVPADDGAEVASDEDGMPQ